jgi:exodeoxyribonuclease V beta subunit
LVELSRDAAPRFAVAGGGGARLRLRTMSRGVHQPWRLTSFSALAASERALPEPVEEGADRDEMTDQPALADEAAAAPAVRGFPRGRQLGNLVHKLFETTDFTARDQTALCEQAARLLPVFAIEPQWTEAICAAITDVLDTPLPVHGASLSLRQVPAARRLNELEFVFPVAWRRPPGDAGDRALSAARLADALAAHGAPWLAEYAGRVRRLPFAQLSGYLKGFIDLVFAHGGQWFVVDYKTNDLGPHATDYRQSRLLAEMQRHHYVLQYHLYSVALHRYLQRRLAGYEYARHFGGVLYLFVRGMAPGHAAGSGVFFDRPAPALIEALSATLAGEATGGAEGMR